MARTVRVRLTRERNGSKEILMVLESRQWKVTETEPNGFWKPAGWALPGGRAKDGEDPWKAAVRELEEETGLTAKINCDPTCVDETNPSHCVVLFDAKEPKGELCPIDQNIMTAQWVPISYLIDTELEHEGIKYPIYKKHRDLAHYQAAA